MTTRNALHDQYHVHRSDLPDGEKANVRAVALGSSFSQQIESGDPRTILAYLMLLVSAAVLTVSGQFPWFVSTLALGLVLSSLFPKEKVADQR